MSGIDSSWVGTVADPYLVEIERGAIRRFAAAIGEEHAIHHDVHAARQAGHADLVAPLTFPVSLRAPEDPPWLRVLDKRRILAGEVGFEYGQPLLAGMCLCCQTRLVRVDEKNGRAGRMQLIVQRTEGRQLENEEQPETWIFTLTRTTLYRLTSRNEETS
jgi:hydroxyacyl-ACP dehydratase HTD2-like protein with hotdog domain